MLNGILALTAAAALTAPFWTSSFTESLPQNPCSGAPSDVLMAGPGEAGERIVVDGRLLAPDGKTQAKGVTVYAYQTDGSGHYSRENGMPPRLRGWVTTDAEGRFTFRTIRPAPYPGRSIPAHIHFQMWGGGIPPQWNTDLLFDDDPLVTDEVRTRASRPGAGEAIRKPVRGEDGILHVTHTMVLKQRADSFERNTRHGLDPCGVLP